MRRSLAFVGEVCCEYEFLHRTVQGTSLQPVKAEVPGSYSIKRRKVPHEHVVKTRIHHGLLDHGKIRRRLNHAEQATVPVRRRAQATGIRFRKIIATCAALHVRKCVRDGRCKKLRALPVLLKQTVDIMVLR